MGGDLLIYGSYGYTGALIARAAVNDGLDPILAGRRAEPVEAQATRLDVDHRVFSLEHDAVVERNLADVDAVLNCAGPFSATASPMVAACLATGTDYVDITGEIGVIEALASHDRDAEHAGIVVLPATGFDVVPTDCLAAHLESNHPGATRLTIAIDGFSSPSPGTAKTIVQGLSRPGIVRYDGDLRSVPVAWKTRTFDFGDGPKPAVSMAWGDLASAYYTTGIDDIETYVTVPRFVDDVLRRTRILKPVYGSRPVKRVLSTIASTVFTGPSAVQRARGRASIVAEITTDDGETVAARLQTPDTYALTVQTALESARHVLDGDVTPGFHTPASAFGPDYVLEFDGVHREPITPETVAVQIES